jgi:phage-related protein
LKGKLWEIKFSQNRIAYVVADKWNIHFLHIFKKQKGKTEKFDLDIALQRADEQGLRI